MKIALLALTVGGEKMAQRLAELYIGKGLEAQVYLPQKLKVNANNLQLIEENPVITREVSYYDKSFKELVSNLFCNYQGLVFIMATGIVVRTIAPLIKDKRTDPAVVVIDEKGDFVIPLLSGHIGGANALAGQLADLLGATPVITTATDVQGKKAPDVLAREFNLAIEPWEKLLQINSLLANGAEVGWFTESDLVEVLSTENQEPKFQPLHKVSAITKTIADTILEILPYQGLVFVTNKLLQITDNTHLFLRPKNLILGIGCRRGTATEDIIKAINKTLAQAGVSVKSLAKLASVDIKSDEQGILEAAEYLQVPVEFYDRKRIQEAFKLWPEMSKSDYVRKQIGVDGVCEPVAMLGGNKTTLLMKKQANQGITTALAEDACWW